MARASCLKLFWHWVRAAASRTFWTAGSRRPIRIAMIAITTNSSIRVKARRVMHRPPTPNRVLRWAGGQLRDVAPPELADPDRRAVCVAGGDLDGDGREELYVLNTDT